jgi:hypothetical protein
MAIDIEYHSIPEVRPEILCVVRKVMFSCFRKPQLFQYATLSENGTYLPGMFWYIKSTREIIVSPRKSRLPLSIEDTYSQ